MTASSIPEDPEPLDRVPAGHALFVPVRSGPAGCTTRFFRSALGTRTAVAFTTRQRLYQTLGADHPFIRLAEPALRAMAAPLGVTTLRIDPGLSARPVVPTMARTAAPAPATTTTAIGRPVAATPPMPAAGPAPVPTAGPASVPAAVPGLRNLLLG
jgi:hypothetical protein